MMKIQGDKRLAFLLAVQVDAIVRALHEHRPTVAGAIVITAASCPDAQIPDNVSDMWEFVDEFLAYSFQVSPPGPPIPAPAWLAPQDDFTTEEA